MSNLIYRFRFALHMWCAIPDMSWREAWNYPINIDDRGDPIEDAEAEMSYMGED